jgi:toxin ParE1/3/4
LRLRWTTPAAEDFYRIISRTREDNIAAAAKVAKTFEEGCFSLTSFPRRGREGRIAGTRELIFPGLPYIVVYQVKDQDVEVLRIYHGAQDWR